MNTFGRALAVRPLILALLVTTLFAHQCMRIGCARPTWNGLAPEYCGNTCRFSAGPMCAAGWHNCIRSDPTDGRAADAAAKSPLNGGGYYQYCSQACRTHALTPAPAPVPVPAPVPAVGSCTSTTATNAQGWDIRTYTFNGMRLQDALRFDDSTPVARLFKAAFFNSLRNTTHAGRMFYLVWKIRSADLNNTSFSWKIVMRPERYYIFGNSNPQENNGFGSRVGIDDAPYMHVSGNAQQNFWDARKGRYMYDCVMVSPGQGGSQGNNRHMWIGPYMQFTPIAEATRLWQMSGNAALARFNGQLDCSQVMQWNGPGANPSSSAGNVSATADGTKCVGFMLAHETPAEVEINTHGHGTPWLHVRIETTPEYNPEAGHV